MSDYIEWEGGSPCPVSDGTIVSVQFKTLPDNPSKPQRADFFPSSLWQHIGSGLDIIGYKVVENAVSQTLN